LSEEDKQRSELSDDLCVVLDRDFFVRAILEIPINGLAKPFTWGIWVSQSRENFDYYFEHFREDLRGRDTFGFFSNRLPLYPDTLELKCRVLFESQSLRPKIHLEEAEHPLSLDFHQGITVERAKEIAEYFLHNSISG